MIWVAWPADPIGDRYQEVVVRPAEHGLLDTLEMYMHCGGSLALAADRLYVHRNTLVQRLERIQEVLEWDPRLTEEWLALQIAIKLWWLDQARPADWR